MKKETAHKKLVIACGSIGPELESLPKPPGTDLYFMDQNLHRIPERLKEEVQKSLDRFDQYDQVVLGYGLCSNGVAGVIPPTQQLFIPRVHDCISLFLGNRNKYKDVFYNYPGSYFLTKSWIEELKDPLGLMENEYTQRVGRETAEWAINEEIKNYKYIIFVNNGVGDTDKCRNRAIENATYFNKEFVEMEGQLAYFHRILNGPYDKTDFVTIMPGEEVKQKDFLK